MGAFWTLVRQVLDNLNGEFAPTTETGERSASPGILDVGIFHSRPADRTERIRAEILMVAPHFSRHEGVCYDEENCDWLMIPKYPLPEKWQNRWCKLLILFPEGYPITPPIGFYLNRKFKLKDGGTDGHLVGTGFHEAPDLRAQRWFWYCVQARDASAGGWRPSPSYNQPDNLWTFLNMVREVLTNDC